MKNFEKVVVAKLRERQLSLATAESCTGGLLAKRITDVPGASEIFQTGIVAYAIETKERLLNVPESMIAQYGVVSAEVAEAMAKGVRQLAKSDLGIGITGIAGPGGGTPEKPVGLIYLALTDGNDSWLYCMQPQQSKNRDRAWRRLQATTHALHLILRYLNK